LVVACDVIYSVNEIAEDRRLFLPLFSVSPSLVVRRRVAVYCNLRFNRLPGAASPPWGVGVMPRRVSPSWQPALQQSADFVARPVENILNSIEPSGMLLTRDWQVVADAWNETSAPGLTWLPRHKPTCRSWYFDYLRQAYPTTIDRTATRLILSGRLEAMEQDPASMSEMLLNQRINMRLR
jgi:hypothetical protein